MARSLLGMRYGSGQRGQAYAEWQNSGGEDEYNKALALKQSGNDRFNVRSLPGGTLGQSFIDSAVGVAGSLDDYAGGVTGIGDWANDYVQSQEMNMGQKPGASLSWDYIVNGLPRDIGNVTGSMAGLALPVVIGTIAAPYLGVGATAAALGGAMVGAGLESMSEGGSKLRESLENGDSLDVAQDKANTVAGKNFALLAPTNALGFGIGKKIVNGVKNAFKAGRTIKAAEAMANAPSRMSRLSDIAKGAGWAGAGVLNEGAQEAIQQGIQDSVEPDKEYGYLPWNWNDEQWSQFKDTLAPMAVLSATGGGARFGARKIGQWLGPEELAPDLDIDTAPSFNVPRTANYNISDEVSDRNLAQSTESKLRLLDQAYYDEYGEHLNVTSMKRHWGTNSKHESGSAFDVADAGLEGTPERRRFLEAKASEIGLKPLDEYENPSDGATGGHMHFSDDGTALNADTGFNGWSGNSDMDSLINTYAEQYGVDPALLAAVAEQESGFNQDAQSEAGAIGTMQLMPDTAKGLGVDPTDMAGNIEGGAKYLSQLMQQFGGDVHKALEAYNGGPGNVGIAQTMKYADEVLERYNKFAGKKAGTFSWKGSPAEVTTTEDYNKLFADNGFAKTDTATNFLENLRMFSQDVEQSKNKQVQHDSKKAEQALNSNDENIIQQTAESLGFNQQDKATAKQAKSPMPIQDIATHVKNNGWVEFGSKANADEFAKSDIAKGMERYSNTGFAVKGYNPYAAPKANAKQSQAPAKPTPKPAQSAQPQPSQSVSMLGDVVPSLPKEELSHHQGAPLNRQEVGRLNSLMQNMPQNDQERIQILFSVKDYDGIRKMIRDNTADEKINRNDIESAKNIAEILMSYPKAMQSAKGGARFSLSQLKNILVNGRLADINRMNNALATRLRENGEDPYKVIKAGKNTKVEPNLKDFLNTMSNKMVRRTHESTLNAKCKYKGQNMSKANRVEKMAANGERFEQRGKKFFGVTSEGDFKATMGEYHYYKYLTQREKETNAQTAPEQAKQKQDAKPVNKPAQQEEKPADTTDKTLNRTSESKNIGQKTQAKQQDSSSMRKELIEQAAANEDTWVNSKKSELHLEDDNDTVVKLTPQELKYYHDLIKKGVVGKPELYKKAPEDVGEMDDNVEMSKEQKQIYDENNGDRDVPNSDSESIEQEENVKENSDAPVGDKVEDSNEHAEQEPRAKYSRDAENQLDNQGEKAENEIEFEGDTPVAQEVFDTYLTDGLKQSTRDIISKQIGENIKDFDALQDPVQMDRTFADLPFIKHLRTYYNYNIIQNNEQYKHRYAVRYEYARRCFNNDERIKSVIAGQVHGDGKQIGVEKTLQATSSERNKRGNGAGLQNGDSGKSVAARLGEYKGIKEQFDKLIDKHSKEKQSRDVSAFSFGENPLSEQALKAKAEFETPLDKLEKVSRERLHKTEQRIQDFGKRIGVPVHFVRHPDKGYRGVCIHNGGIYINLNSNVPARRIFMHEFTHWLKASGEDNHKIFTALASVIETKQGTFNEIRMNDYRRRLYGGEEMSDSQIIEEIVADAMSNSESAEQIMRAIERYNPDMNVSLWSKIKALWDKFCEAVGFKQNVSAHNQPELYPAEQTGKLRQGLNNRELANFNTTLNNLMRKIKDSEGNNVFTMDGTRLTIQGKPFEDVVKVQSVEDYRPTVRRLEPAMMFSRDKNADVTDIKNNLNTANKNLNKSLGGEITWRDELAYKLTRGAFGKTKKLDNLMVKTHKDLEYDRLVAQGKDPAMYKEVGLLQKVFTSPRRIANRVPLLMPIVKSAVRATERQERLRGEFNEGMNEIMRTLGWNESPLKRNDKKMRERQDKLQRILLAGDLGQTEFTEAQLREHGADRRVIKAYDLMRKLLDKAWEMANNIKEQNKYTTENFASEGMAEARLKDLQKENPFVEKARTQSGANGEVVITFRTPNIRHINKLHVSKMELDALKKNKNVHVNEVELTERDANDSNLDTYLVSYVEKNRPMGKIKGYIPHLFNGYNLVVADKDGNVKFGKDGLPMVVSTHRSISEAVKEGSRLAEKNSNVNFVVQPQMNEFMGSAEQAAVLGDYSYSKVMHEIANGMNISLADAKKLTEDGLTMKSRGRFLGYTMQRKGVTGYEKNVYKATQMYFNQVARYVALDPFKRDAINYYNRTWGAFDDSKVIARSINAAFAHRYINDINGVPTGVEKALNDIAHNYLRVSEERASGRPGLWLTRAMTYPMTIAKLGILNMSSALLNLTQLVNLYGAMGEKTMSPEAYKRLLKQGFIGSMKAMRNKNSAEHKLLFDEMGLKYQIGIDVASGYSNTEVGGIAGLAGKFNRLAGGSMYLFKQSDVFTKGVTMLTAYHKALAEGKSKEEAIEYAKEVNTKVNFDYSTADAPELFRALGPIGAVLLQFQKYPVKQLELFKDIFDDGRSQGLNRKRSLMRLAKYMTPYMAMSGIMGVPFVSLIGGIANLFGGDDFDWDEWIKQHMIEEFGEDSLITQSILYGGGAMFGFNVGSRVGVGDFGGISSQESTAAEMLAGKSTLLSTFMSMKRQIGYGNYVEALKSLSPSVGNIAIGLKGEVHTTRGRMKYQYQNAYEQALRMIGFNPVNESLAGDLASIEYSQQNDEKHEKEKAVDAFIDEPTNENAQKLQELGVTPKTIQNEVARRTMNTHDLNKLKEQEKKEKEAKLKNKKKEKQYTANDYLKEMK